MTPTTVYTQLLDELAAGQLRPLQQKVLDVLRQYYPAPVSRQRLIGYIFGYRPEEINNNTDDRKIREAIADMRDMAIPIISSSSDSGYRLDISLEALDGMRAENCSRIEHLTDRNNAIERARQKIKQLGIAAIPTTLPKKERAEQPALFGRN